MLYRMNRTQAYFASLKYFFQTEMVQNAPRTGFDRLWLKHAYEISKRRASEYAFRVKTEHLNTIPVWA